MESTLGDGNDSNQPLPSELNMGNETFSPIHDLVLSCLNLRHQVMIGFGDLWLIFKGDHTNGAITCETRQHGHDCLQSWKTGFSAGLVNSFLHANIVIRIDYINEVPSPLQSQFELRMFRPISDGPMGWDAHVSTGILYARVVAEEDPTPHWFLNRRAILVSSLKSIRMKWIFNFEPYSHLADAYGDNIETWLKIMEYLVVLYNQIQSLHLMQQASSSASSANTRFEAPSRKQSSSSSSHSLEEDDIPLTSKKSVSNKTKPLPKEKPKNEKKEKEKKKLDKNKKTEKEKKKDKETKLEKKEKEKKEKLKESGNGMIKVPSKKQQETPKAPVEKKTGDDNHDHRDENKQLQIPLHVLNPYDIGNGIRVFIASSNDDDDPSQRFPILRNTLLENLTPIIHIIDGIFFTIRQDDSPLEVVLLDEACDSQEVREQEQDEKEEPVHNISPLERMLPSFPDLLSHIVHTWSSFNESVKVVGSPSLFPTLHHHQQTHTVSELFMASSASPINVSRPVNLALKMVTGKLSLELDDVKNRFLIACRDPWCAADEFEMLRTDRDFRPYLHNEKEEVLERAAKKQVVRGKNLNILIRTALFASVLFRSGASTATTVRYVDLHRITQHVRTAIIHNYGESADALFPHIPQRLSYWFDADENQLYLSSWLTCPKYVHEASPLVLESIMNIEKLPQIAQRLMSLQKITWSSSSSSGLSSCVNRMIRCLGYCANRANAHNHADCEAEFMALGALVRSCTDPKSRIYRDFDQMQVKARHYLHDNRRPNERKAVGSDPDPEPLSDDVTKRFRIWCRRNGIPSDDVDDGDEEDDGGEHEKKSKHRASSKKRNLHHVIPDDEEEPVVKRSKAMASFHPPSSSYHYRPPPPPFPSSLTSLSSSRPPQHYSLSSSHHPFMVPSPSSYHHPTAYPSSSSSSSSSLSHNGTSHPHRGSITTSHPVSHLTSSFPFPRQVTTSFQNTSSPTVPLSSLFLSTSSQVTRSLISQATTSSSSSHMSTFSSSSSSPSQVSTASSLSLPQVSATTSSLSLPQVARDSVNTEFGVLYCGIHNHAFEAADACRQCANKRMDQEITKLTSVQDHKSIVKPASNGFIQDQSSHSFHQRPFRYSDFMTMIAQTKISFENSDSEKKVNVKQPIYLIGGFCHTSLIHDDDGKLHFQLSVVLGQSSIHPDGDHTRDVDHQASNSRVAHVTFTPSSSSSSSSSEVALSIIPRISHRCPIDDEKEIISCLLTDTLWLPMNQSSISYTVRGIPSLSSATLPYPLLPPLFVMSDPGSFDALEFTAIGSVPLSLSLFIRHHTFGLLRSKEERIAESVRSFEMDTIEVVLQHLDTLSSHNSFCIDVIAAALCGRIRRIWKRKDQQTSTIVAFTSGDETRKRMTALLASISTSIFEPSSLLLRMLRASTMHPSSIVPFTANGHRTLDRAIAFHTLVQHATTFGATTYVFSNMRSIVRVQCPQLCIDFEFT